MLVVMASRLAPLTFHMPTLRVASSMSTGFGAGYKTMRSRLKQLYDHPSHVMRTMYRAIATRPPVITEQFIQEGSQAHLQLHY